MHFEDKGSHQIKARDILRIELGLTQSHQTVQEREEGVVSRLRAPYFLLLLRARGAG